MNSGQIISRSVLGGLLVVTLITNTYAAAEDFVPTKTKSDSAHELMTFTQQVSTSSGAQALLAIVLVLLVGLLMFYYGLAKILPIVVVVLLLGGLGIGLVQLSQPAEPTLTKAVAKEVPKNIQLIPNTETSVIISWQTDVEAISAVYYGEDAAVLDFTSYGEDPSLLTKQHVILLDGLTQGTRYYYQISSNGQIFTDNNYFFDFPL